MEDVLDVYTRPYDPRYPQICMDEASKQLLRDIRQPLPMELGTRDVRARKRAEAAIKRHGPFSLYRIMKRSVKEPI